MPRIPNRYGGGSNTNLYGLHFEQTTDLKEALINSGYEVYGYDVILNNNRMGLCCNKHAFYSSFLEPNGIYYLNYNSKRWLPDDVFVNYSTRTVYIIEKKFQHSSGSVDEKLPNCHFKKMEYEKLCNPIGYSVEFLYILSDWFRQDIYKDTLDYILYMGCHYYFNTLPLRAIGL